jgi:hypothetical protein
MQSSVAQDGARSVTMALAINLAINAPRSSGTRASITFNIYPLVLGFGWVADAWCRKVVPAPRAFLNLVVPRTFIARAQPRPPRARRGYKLFTSSQQSSVNVRCTGAGPLPPVRKRSPPHCARLCRSRTAVRVWQYSCSAQAGTKSCASGSKYRGNSLIALRRLDASPRQPAAATCRLQAPSCEQDGKRWQ